ncbi:hypothetical protein TNCV_3553181 [Trichonephila clavipes]|nr:hypothetical protein TNCV_3553181 [Trichonephila clavipes]
MNVQKQIPPIDSTDRVESTYIVSWFWGQRKWGDKATNTTSFTKQDIHKELSSACYKRRHLWNAKNKVFNYSRLPYSNGSPAYLSGHGRELVVGASSAVSWVRVLLPLKIRWAEGLMHIKFLEINSPYVGVGLPAQVLSPSLDHEVHHQ